LGFYTNFNSILIPKSIIFQNRFEPIPDLFKQDIYNQCRSISQRSYILQPLSSHNHKINSLQDVYLLLHYSPRTDDEGGLYLQMATSYLLSQNLQQLSIEQQTRTRVAVFLNENYTNLMYTRLEQWFKSIYTPYTLGTHIIRLKNDNESLGELMINYSKSNKDIQLDTILFFLEDDYIFETDMLYDTIGFFVSHNPCFVYQTDHSDRCRLNINDGFGHLLVPGKTRLWRSISSTTISFACRLKTFLAFEDLIMNSTDDLELNQKIRARMGGDEVFFCAIPSYSARMETLLLPNEVNITDNDDTAVYYKDWRSMARHALAEAQKLDSFPCPKINEQNLFA
jgi:hypothetical protein